MSFEMCFTKDNLDKCLVELAKEFRKLNGRVMSAEIILVGGAAVLAQYGFRELTYDIDALIFSSSAMKEAANKVGDQLGLPDGWLNMDFKRTGSYSETLIQVSVHYKTFSNILEVRTIGAQYLIAMKLMSGRQYKNDLSDVAGILMEHQKKGQNISRESIDDALRILYKNVDKLAEDSKQFIDGIFEEGDYERIYKETREREKISRDNLIANHEHRDKIKEESVDYILKKAKEKRNAK
jgi:hypothetical protein